MPRMTQTRKIFTDDVQGEGSYVEVTSPKVGEIRLCNLGDASAQYEAALALIATHIKKWNWQDEDGVDLPIPGEDDSVIDGMTNAEVVFLLRAINSISGATSKN